MCVACCMRVYFSVRGMRMFVSVLHQDVLSVYCATQVSVLYGSVIHIQCEDS